MRISLYIIILICATSCGTKLLPVTTIVKDSIVTNTVYVPKDSIIKLAGDSVRIHDTIPCPDVEYHKEVVSTKGSLRAVVDIAKGKLNVDCKQDSLLERISWLEKQQYSVNHHKEVKTIVVEKQVPKRYIPNWVWWLVAYTVVSLIWRYRGFFGSIISKFLKKS